MYDLIGDIHGCAKTLQKMLEQLGYSKEAGGIYSHPKRKVIYLGDFIDRGPYQREVIGIVRPMITAGFAYSVMGNHEFNAIAFATQKDENDGFGPENYLRPHSEKNIKQHIQFLKTYTDIAYDPNIDFEEWYSTVRSTPDYLDDIAWFKTLPLWLESEGIRVIHACWDTKLIAQLDSPFLDDAVLTASVKPDTPQFNVIETLLKGKEIRLPGKQNFKDKDGNVRHFIRVRWWDRQAITYRSAFMGPESARTNIPDDAIGGDHLVEYTHEDPPVFLGHYWMNDEVPEPLAKNIACLDYSVAKPNGKLVGYRWSGENVLQAGNYQSVDRIEWPGFSDTGSILMALSSDICKQCKESIQINGSDFILKKEFHITLLASQLGRKIELAVMKDDSFYARFEDAFKAVCWDNCTLGDARLIRRTRENDFGENEIHQSIIVMVSIPGFESFFDELNAMKILDNEVPIPPLHVTLYTSKCDKGIGIPDFDTLSEYTNKMLPFAEIMQLK